MNPKPLWAVNPARWLCRARATLAAVGVVALSACAGYAPGDLKPGQSAAEVRLRMGEPTAQYPLPSGDLRLEYARGPAGLHTYMVDVDAQGRVIGWNQVLTPASFARVAPGWPRDQVLRELGQPTQDVRYPRLQQRVWSYRYDSWDCTWFQVTFNETTQRVTETSSGPDPRCERPDMPSLLNAPPA